jgi:hypothetical protein
MYVKFYSSIIIVFILLVNREIEFISFPIRDGLVYQDNQRVLDFCLESHLYPNPPLKVTVFIGCSDISIVQFFHFLPFSLLTIV